VIRSRVLTLLDQAFSSLSNVLAIVLVARVLDRNDFGRFALAYSVLTLVLALSRAYFGTRVSLADRSQVRRLTAKLLGSLILLAPLAMLAVLGVSAVAAGGQSLYLVVIVAVATPIVCIQDIVRFGASATGRPMAALLSDGLWCAVMAVPLVLRVHWSAPATLGLWLGAAVLALAVALLVFRAVPDFAGGRAELRRKDAVGSSVTVGAILATVAFLWVLIASARIIGPSAAGSLRGAATSMGPVNVLIAFTALGLTPALVRRDRRHDIRFSSLTAASLGGLTLLWGTVLLLLPNRWGSAGFGESWTGVRHVLPFTVVEYTAASVAAGATLALKVRQQSRLLLWQRGLAALVVVVLGTSLGLITHQATGVAAGLAAGAIVAVLAGWLPLLRGAAPARERQGQPVESDDSVLLQEQV
jgi:O-antigen/teichoic acid export membrane protein